jgi:peptide/nickel transport system permease protein
MKFLTRRLIHGLVLLAAVSVISFLLAQMAGGDFYSELRNDPRISDATIARLRARAGLDRSLPVRYGMWAGSLLRGDFGYSLAYQSPVAPLLWERTRATLLLTGTATLLAWLLAVPLGIWNAAHRGTWRDGAARFILAILLTVPDLLLALALLVVAAQTGWFPVGGKHLALPLAVLVLGLAPALVRHVRASLLEAMDSPFALSARAQGIPRRRRLYRHLLPAALNPLISLFGFSLGTLLGASLLIEVVTGWPGLGPLFLEAIMARDFAIVLAVVMLSAVFLQAGNFLADLLLYRCDPRIRTVDR